MVMPPDQDGPPPPPDGDVPRGPHVPRGPRAYLRLALGWVLVIAGLPMFFTPIPLGVIMVAAGLFVLARTSVRARGVLYGLFRRFPETLSPVRRTVERLGRRG